MKKTKISMAAIIKVILSIAVIFPAALLSKADNPHSEFEDKSSCAGCHVENKTHNPTEYEKDKFTTDFSSFCMECHDNGDMTHPINVEVDYDIPEDLVLADESRITCVTCHTVHGDHESDRPWSSSSFLGRLGSIFNGKKAYKTYFLRRNNSSGELCLTCHKN